MARFAKVGYNASRRRMRPRTQESVEGHQASEAATPLGTRERRRLRKRRELQTVALRLFQEQGYASTTVHEVAAAADISSRSFFRYFSSKEDLVLWDEYDPTFLQALEARPPDEPIIDSLRAAALEWVREFTAGDRERVLVRIRLFSTVRELQGRYWEGQEALASHVAECVARPRKLVPDSLEIRVIALAFIAALAAATEAWMRTDGEADLGALVVDALDVLRRGLNPARPRNGASARLP